MIFILSSICTILVSAFHIDAECAPRNSSGELRFQREPEKVFSGFNDRYSSIECCMDGYVILLWKFRKMNKFSWEQPSERKIRGDENRTLSIEQSLDGYDTGFYRCTGEDQSGVNISRIIFMYFLNINAIKYIQLIPTDTSRETRLLPGKDVNLSCSGKTYYPLWPVSVTWWYRNDGNDGVILREHVIKTVVMTASNRSGETNLDLVDIQSYLHLSNIRIRDGGYYSCQMEQKEFHDKMTFMISVSNDQINWVMLLSLNAALVTLFGSCVLTWRYHYDIIVIYKSYIDPCPRVHDRDIDVSIIHEDMDHDSQPVSMEILRVLEKQRFRCWHYDRDKIYGRDILEDVMNSINKSAVLLVILSSFSVTTGALISKISSMAINPAVRRLYLFIPSRKCVLSKLSGKTLKWMKQELILRSLFQNNTFNYDMKRNGKFNYEKLSTWVIAFAPSAAIRDANDRMYKESVL